MTIATIVTALDLAPGSERVAARARQLAEEHGARLVALHVVEDLPASEAALPGGLEPGLLTTLLEDSGHERLRSLLGPAAELHVEAGLPHALITRLAGDCAADLVVIGPGVARGLRERVFGSTADRVTRCAPCPVLVVRRAPAGPYARVVTGMDFSDHARAAAGWAARIAPGARRSFVHADDIPLGFEQSMLKTGTSQAEIGRYRAARAAIARQKLVDSLARAGIAPGATIRIRQGDPAIALLAAARRADLLVIGTQGTNAVARHILGSVARKVLMHAPCDTLVVPG